MNNIDKCILLGLFSSYTLKAGILGASIADAIIILGLGASYFMHQLHIKNKSEANLQKQIDELKSAQFDQNGIISELRTAVTGVKLGQVIKKAQ